jgi:integrase
MTMTHQVCPLSTWTSRYLKIRKSEIAKKTFNKHTQATTLLMEFFGDVPIDHINRSMATDWRLWLRENKGFAESTTCTMCAVAKVIFNRAIDDEVIEQNPFSRLRVTPPKKDIFSRRVIEEKEVQAVMSHAKEIEKLIALTYYAGLRTSEAIHLMSVDIAGLDRIYVRPRGGEVTTKQKYREVRQEEVLQKMFKRADGTACGLVERRRQETIWGTMRDACMEAKVEPFTFQQLRQSRDTLWRKSFEPYIVCAWLGHSEQVSRDHYLTIDKSSYLSPIKGTA